MISMLSARFSACRELVRLRPFDTSTQEGRAKERLRLASLTSISALLSRVISMAGPIITVPLALGYLGHDRYGLWMTVGSIVGMFAFADLGLGNGLMTELSQADGRGDLSGSQRCVTSAFIALSTVGLILLGVYAVAFPFVPWGRLLNAASPDLLHESGAVATVCFITFLLNLPLGVVQRTLSGLQRGFQNNVWQCAGSMINIGVVLTAVKAHASLPILVLCVTGVPPLVNLLNGIAFFFFQRPELKPSLKEFHWATARRLLGTGFWFFLVSILLAIGVYSDNVVVAHVIGLSSVPLYSVPSSLAIYLGTLAAMLYTPFWAANGEALARGDVGWVRLNTIRIVKLNALITGSAGLMFVIGGPIFLHLWIGRDFSPGRWVFAGLASWAFLTSVAGPLFMILNGANSVKIQVLVFSIFSTIAIGLKILLAHKFGIAGVVWASVAPYACLVLPVIIVAVNKLLNRSEKARVEKTNDIQLSLAECKKAIT